MHEMNASFIQRKGLIHNAALPISDKNTVCCFCTWLVLFKSSLNLKVSGSHLHYQYQPVMMISGSLLTAPVNRFQSMVTCCQAQKTLSNARRHACGASCPLPACFLPSVRAAPILLPALAKLGATFRRAAGDGSGMVASGGRALPAVALPSKVKFTSVYAARWPRRPVSPVSPL